MKNSAKKDKDGGREAFKIKAKNQKRDQRGKRDAKPR